MFLRPFLKFSPENLSRNIYENLSLNTLFIVCNIIVQNNICHIFDIHKGCVLHKIYKVYRNDLKSRFFLEKSNKYFSFQKCPK